MRISDWSSDVCSSDLPEAGRQAQPQGPLGTLGSSPRVTTGGVAPIVRRRQNYVPPGSGAIDAMLKLYDGTDSGNGYKVRLLLHLLEIPHDLVELDAVGGETRKPPFLQKNPTGRITLLELDDGSYLPESKAILFYLPEHSRYLPDDRLGRARALQWMFFEPIGRAHV